MENSNFWRKAVAVAAVLAMASAGAAFAQLQTGNLYGTATDNNGEALPGVTVTVAGIGAPQIQVTNADGQFRFLGLSPGGYSLKAELEGFSTVDYPNVTISVGRNTTLEVTLSAAVEEVITVTSESPLLDERKISTGTTVSQVELEKIPTSRDPWAILNQTPGVLSDRINVGGNESGQQSNYISPGTDSSNSVWAVDGVVITDMGALGSSPSYYNFDSFEEMQITTGGSDAGNATGGVALNMVTKRGTNEWRFSGRYLLTDESWQSSTDLDDSELGNGQLASLIAAGLGGFSQGNRIVEVQDFGIEGGGPIVEDKLWFWGSYGVQEIDLLTAQTADSPNGVSDFTELESYAAKLNAQLSTSNSLVGFYHYGDKIKIGRNAGPTRPQPTTWNQDGPTDIYKLEDTHIFNSNFYLTGMASFVGGGFQLVPQGGGIGDPNFPNVVRNSDGVWQNSFLIYQTDRPQEQAKLDGNYFFNTGSTSHELRFGVNLRNAAVESFSAWPGQKLVGLADIAFGPDLYLGFGRTDRNVDIEGDYTSVYLQDTLTFGNLTANIGVRYDTQDGTNNPSVIPALAVCPAGSAGCAEGGAFGGIGSGFEWETITPRLGLTYALGEDRDTLLRFSYSQFADQLGSSTISTLNPANYQYAYFLWYDNGDQVLTADEAGGYFSFSGGVDPSNGGGLVNNNQIVSGLDAPITDEIVLSVEHSLLPEFLIGATVTIRNYHDLLENERLIVDNGVIRTHQPGDYVDAAPLTGTLPNGDSYTIVPRRLAPGLATAGGSRLENGDREQDYMGVSLLLHKRLANRWSLRGSFTWSDWEWSVPSSELEYNGIELPGSSVDGGAVLVGSGTGSGAKGNVFINSNWAFTINGLYQIAPDRPWGFDVAGIINGREGYPIPFTRRNNARDGFGTRNLLINSDVEAFRNDDILTVDARISKEFVFNDFGLEVSIDGFNLLNEGTVLQRRIRNGSTQGWVNETLSPRIFRIGARLNFR